MAYRPEDHPDLYAGKRRPFREKIPRGAVKSRFVHFDIDPKNGRLIWDSYCIKHPRTNPTQQCSLATRMLGTAIPSSHL
jgi:hypothetical protein